ncbi:hypothetical protein [Clostridium polyendosporum]|nr:hypothetical protein [Clostridium polyendosporum]
MDKSINSWYNISVILAEKDTKKAFLRLFLLILKYRGNGFVYGNDKG